ncbi:acyl-CoA dehydrogenase family protein [Jatrophihabitans sp. DSM 45814]
MTPPEDTTQDMLAALDRWLEKDVVPYVLELEHADEYPSAMVEQMRDFGLFGATIPEEYGGLGMTASSYAKVVERLSSVWISLSGVINSHLMMAELIRRFGTEEQRREILPACASGELRGGMALTEPQCGSDLQAIRTRADRTEAGYTINGAKTWITNAGRGNCLAVLLKTDTEIEPRHKGMSLFFVRKSDGYMIGKKLGKLGYKGIDTVEVFFDDVAVDAEQLIGTQEGLGFKQTVGALELGRINVAARGAGVADAALQASLEYSRIRTTMGKPIGQHQAIQLKLADMACRVASSRALIAIAAEAFDNGQRCDLEAGMAKLVASESALANATAALQIHGAYGYSTEVGIERIYRDAPVLSIGEGTSDIQRMLIAQRLLERG